eukprot:3089695-Amphidinium_carterae.1
MVNCSLQCDFTFAQELPQNLCSNVIIYASIVGRSSFRWKVKFLCSLVPSTSAPKNKKSRSQPRP